MENEFQIYNTLSGGSLKEKVQIKPVIKEKDESIDKISDGDKDRIKRLREKINILEGEIKKIENK